MHTIPKASWVQQQARRLSTIMFVRMTLFVFFPLFISVCGFFYFCLLVTLCLLLFFLVLFQFFQCGHLARNKMARSSFRALSKVSGSNSRFFSALRRFRVTCKWRTECVTPSRAQTRDPTLNVAANIFFLRIEEMSPPRRNRKSARSNRNSFLSHFWGHSPPTLSVVLRGKKKSKKYTKAMEETRRDSSQSCRV